jgi:hypothetical protein
MPTTSQVYLAVDILATVNPAEPSYHPMRAAAQQVVVDALKEGGWTGKTAYCSEYGKPPTSVDPEAQEATRFMAGLTALMKGMEAVGKTAEDIGKSVKAFVDDFRK